MLSSLNLPATEDVPMLSSVVVEDAVHDEDGYRRMITEVCGVLSLIIAYRVESNRWYSENNR